MRARLGSFADAGRPCSTLGLLKEGEDETLADGLPLFEGPHSVRIDPQDNLWYVDAGTNLIAKFDSQKRVLMILGRRPEPSTWMTHVIARAIPGPENFYQPTDVTWGPDGSIYVSEELSWRLDKKVVLEPAGGSQ